MNPNFISVHTIISKVFADLDLPEKNHRILDMINYAAEAIEHIGAVRCLQFKQTGEDGVDHIRIKDYVAALPKDLFKLSAVLYTPIGNKPNERTRWYPTRVSGNTMGPTKDSLTTNVTYIVRPGSLHFNQRSGWAKVVYYAFPTDCNGYPLIPDTATYIEAVYWYIAHKLLYPMWLKGEIRDAVYAEAKHNWVLYRNNAYAESQLPSEEELLSIGNAWLTMIPDPRPDLTHYGMLGQREELKNHNSRYHHIADVTSWA